MTDRGTAGGVVGIVGASGGVGASTFAVALGVVAVRAGLRCVCIDARPLAGGLDVVAGLDREPGLRWSHLHRVEGPVPGADLIGRLPAAAGLAVLSHARTRAGEPPEAALAGVLAGLRHAVDLCIVDLPTMGHSSWSWWSGRVEALMVVVGHCLPALAAASAIAPLLGTGSPDATWLLQRVGRGRPGQLAQVSAGVLDLPVAASVPDDPDVARALRRGRPPASRSGPLQRSCERSLAALGYAGSPT